MRIQGIDFARFIAIVGMVFVNFKIALVAQDDSSVFANFIGLFEGRAAALFVILAGIGVGLSSRRAILQNNSEKLYSVRKRFLKRATLLVVVGLSYSWIWPADILHFYGFYIAIGAFVINWQGKELWGLIAALLFGFVVMLALFTYEKGWDFTTLEYLDFWTVEGMVRHIFFNGFHPVFPWAAFLIFGIWLSRQALSCSQFKKKLFLISLVILILIESLSFLALDWAKVSLNSVSLEDQIAIFGTTPMPPLPQYMISAMASASIIICFSIYLCEKLNDSSVIRWFSNTGKMSLSIYIGHVVVGLGLFDALGLLANTTAMVAFFLPIYFASFL